MLHDIGKAVDHDVEGVHAIIGGELLRVLGVDAGIVHAVKAHHFDEEPSTDLAMLTICADAISASRPGARRDTLATYLLRLEQLQTIATRHGGVDRAFPLQAGRELRVFVKASQVKDTDMPPLTAEIAREIEFEMQYPGRHQGDRDPGDDGDGNRARATRPRTRSRRRTRQVITSPSSTTRSTSATTTAPTRAEQPGTRRPREFSTLQHCGFPIPREEPMAFTTRFGALLALPAAVALLSACGGSSSAGVTAAASTSAPTASAAPTPTSTPAPTQPLRTAPPKPTSSVDRSGPGPFGGSWTGNGVTLNVSSDEFRQRDVFRRRAVQFRLAGSNPV